MEGDLFAGGGGGGVNGTHVNSSLKWAYGTVVSCYSWVKDTFLPSEELAKLALDARGKEVVGL